MDNPSLKLNLPFDIYNLFHHKNQTERKPRQRNGRKKSEKGRGLEKQYELSRQINNFARCKERLVFPLDFFFRTFAVLRVLSPGLPDFLNLSLASLDFSQKGFFSHSTVFIRVVSHRDGSWSIFGLLFHSRMFSLPWRGFGCEWSIKSMLLRSKGLRVLWYGAICEKHF